MSPIWILGVGAVERVRPTSLVREDISAHRDAQGVALGVRPTISVNGALVTTAVFANGARLGTI